MFTQLKYPIIQAPMAGGVSTVQLTIAVSKNGGLGFLAAGYKTVEQLEEEIKACKNEEVIFGVNIFVPSNDPYTKEAKYYHDTLQQQFNMELHIYPDSTDFYDEKLALVKHFKVPYVSFTFGCPSIHIITDLQQAGIQTIVTVTSLAEAFQANEAGANAICVQGIEAGGHRASFQNEDVEEEMPLAKLIEQIRREIDLPIIAAGGIMTGQHIKDLLRAGANAAQLGTAFLCADESGANDLYKQMLLSKSRETVMTRAFTGRLARGLENTFTNKYATSAPKCYPAVHFMTQPIRKSALENKNPENMSMWAGVNYPFIKQGSAKEIIQTLVDECYAAK